MSGLDIFFVRSSTGYQMEEFYYSSVEYLCFGDLACLLGIIKNLLEQKNQIYLVDSKFEVDSPSSYIIDDSMLGSRLILTERPVRVKGFKQMEIVFSGNSRSYTKLYNYLSQLNSDTSKSNFKIGYKLDGIIDEILFPLGVGLSFDKTLELTKPIDSYNQNFIFPREIEYMDLPEESRTERMSALREFRARILSRIDRCYQ